MSKQSKCAKNCDSSSSGSDACYKVHPEPVPTPCVSCCGDASVQLLEKYKDAVVEIHSEFILTAGLTTVTGATPLGVTGDQPFGATGRADVFLEGNGFFIKGHYIIAPAHLVLMPPSLTSTVNRYPFLNPADLVLGQIKNTMVRASRILVSVFNVNGNGHSFCYEADLVGVDGAGDVAVLRINSRRQWNLCNPCIDDTHPYLNFGSSRCSKKGECVYLIGDYIGSRYEYNFNAVGAISTGVLSDNRYLDYAGYMLPEAVLVSAPAYSFSSGLPILNNKGEVLGMQTTDLAAADTLLPQVDRLPQVFQGYGMVSGPSEFFMRRVIKALIKGTCRNRFDSRVVNVSDPIGNYLKYRKGYAGLAYDVFTSLDYDTTTDFTNGPMPNGLRRVRLNSVGAFVNSPSCKELIGIRVLGLAGANPEDSFDGTVAAGGVAGSSYWYVPGGTGTAPLVPFLEQSPFLNRLQAGDVITHLQGVPLGDLEKQAAPTLVTWRLLAGDQVELYYRRGGNYPNNGPNNSAGENYDNLFTITGAVLEFPELMDYPWYAVTKFPTITARGFNMGPQMINPQYPSLIGGAPFRPAF